MAKDFHLEPLQAASSAIVLARAGQAPIFDDDVLGDMAREVLVEGLALWVAQHRGWVYLAHNEAWPGVFKIGCTRKGINSRMLGLNRTGVVTAWRALITWEGYDAFGMETRAHGQCKAFSMGAEMFKADPAELVAQVRVAMGADQQLMLSAFSGVMLPDELEELFRVEMRQLE